MCQYCKGGMFWSDTPEHYRIPTDPQNHYIVQHCQACKAFDSNEAAAKAVTKNAIRLIDSVGEEHWFVPKDSI